MWDIYTPIPVITGITSGGLCNRFRGIISGILLSKALGYAYVVNWPIDKWMPVHFLELFEDAGLAFTPNRPPGVYLFSAIAEDTHPWIRLRTPKASLACGVDGDADFRAVSPEPFMLRTYHHLAPVGVSDCEFMRAKRRFGLSLRPVPPIQSDVDEVSAHFDSTVVGVHIRMSDTRQYWADREYPPMQLYVSQMDSCLRDSSETRFFVSADNEGARNQLIERYGDRIMSTPGILGRDLGERYSWQGQADAVVDLFCLARTRKIIGTHLSSFTYEAATLGSVPLVEVSGKKSDNWSEPGSVVVTPHDDLDFGVR
ncbi:MAG: hypothetical protein NVSMB52_08380 [Chloroflexota bacterium]